MQISERVWVQSSSPIWPHAWPDLQHDRTSPSESTVSVLVVDDDERVLRLTARMLRDEGYRVIEAHNAKQAWERLAEAREVQVVLTDIGMPEGSGIELADRILAERASLRVVLMSGYDRMFPKLGSPGARLPLLIKPFTPEQLVRQIRAVLGIQDH